MVNPVYFTDMFKMCNVLYIHKSNNNLGLFTHTGRILTLVYTHTKSKSWLWYICTDPKPTIGNIFLFCLSMLAADVM